MGDFAIVKQAARTTTGTQDYTSSGFGTPVGALFFVTYGTANGTVVAHAHYGVGATDMTRSISGAALSEDAQAAADNFGIGDADDCLTILSTTGTVIGLARFSATVTDGVRINWTTAPGSGYLVTCVLFGGSGVTNAYASTMSVSATLDAETAVNIGFQPDVVFVWSCIVSSWNGTSASQQAGNGCLSFGVAVNDGSATQRSLTMRDTPTVSPTQSQNVFSDAYAFRYPVSGQVAVEIGNFVSTGFSNWRRLQATSSAKTMGFLALKFNALGVNLMTVDSPTGTGSYSITGAGFTPQFALMINSGLTAVNTITATAGEADYFGVGLVDADGVASSVGYYVQDNVSTTNTESVTNTTPVSLSDGSAGAFQAETFTAYTSDGMTLNAGTVSTARKRAVLFIESSQGPLTPAVGSGSFAGIASRMDYGLGTRTTIRGQN